MTEPMKNAETLCDFLWPGITSISNGYSDKIAMDLICEEKSGAVFLILSYKDKNVRVWIAGIYENKWKHVFNARANVAFSVFGQLLEQEDTAA
jgi:hypothetical protein